MGNINECREHFLLSVVALTAQKLEKIVKESGEVRLRYKILENEVPLKPLSVDQLNGNSPINEKIVVRVRSSTTILKNYFKQRKHLILNLEQNGEILIKENVDLGSLVDSEEFINVKEKSVQLKKRCHLDGISNLNGKITQCFFISLSTNKRFKFFKSKIVTVEKALAK